MNYIEANLASDEKVVARIKHSWKGLIATFIISVIICAVGIVLITVVCPLITDLISESEADLSLLSTIIEIVIYGISAFLFLTSIMGPISDIVDIKCSQLVVTDKRLFGRRGFISRQTTDIMLSKVDTINAENGFFGRIFHYGSIQIVSAASGTDKATLNYDNISNSTEFRKAVLEAIEKAKAKEREEQAKAMRDAMKANEEA